MKCISSSVSEESSAGSVQFDAQLFHAGVIPDQIRD